MSSSSDTKPNSGGNVGGSEAKMSSDTKTTKPNIGDKVKVGSGFRSKLDHYLYSGDKKHVFAGLVLITAVFSVPWFLMSRGSFPFSFFAFFFFLF